MLTWRTIATSAPSEANALAAHLLEQTLDGDYERMAAYYAGADSPLAESSTPRVRADLPAELAGLLGVKPGKALTERQFVQIIAGRRADGSELAGDQRKIRTYKGGRYRIAGMDLCLSAPKSFSVAWFSETCEGRRNSLLQCHRDAHDATLRYIEAQIARAGRGKGHRQAGYDTVRTNW